MESSRLGDSDKNILGKEKINIAFTKTTVYHQSVQ